MPIGGRTKFCYNNWKRLTKDRFILDNIQGCKINFKEMPKQITLPRPIIFTKIELKALESILEEFVNKNIIKPCKFEKGDYLNTVFLREKKDSTPEKPIYRMILNMKKLNKGYIELIHHKICSLQTCLDLIEPNWFMASLDLKEAFYTIPMDEAFTKYLKFCVNGTFYKFVVLPMGFRDSPRIFCKILKPVLAHLRSKGFLSSLYIDDFFLTGPTFTQCEDNVHHTMTLLKSLGFEFSDKSCLQPTTKLQHLGFIIDSENMTVSLSLNKIHKIKELLQSTLNKTFISVRQLASIIGTLVATFPGVAYGPLYYRELELLKINSLKQSKNYKRRILLSPLCKIELCWWTTTGLYSHKPISRGNPDYVIQTDASNVGWGAVLLATNTTTQGLWSNEETQSHINLLELKAAFLGITALCYNLQNCHL